MNNSLEFIKQHVTEWPVVYESASLTHCMLLSDGVLTYGEPMGTGRINPYVHTDLSEHFAPSYYDGKMWTREEFEAWGVADVRSSCAVIDWNNAPSWATCFGIGVGILSRHVWYNNKQYMYADDPIETYTFDVGNNRNIDEITHYADRPTPNTETSTGIDATVEERGNHYGAFKDGADIMQELKSVMRSTRNWSKLTPSQREALEMIQHKVGRILNGDPNYTDSWHDIKGYAHLIEEELNGNVK